MRDREQDQRGNGGDGRGEHRRNVGIRGDDSVDGICGDRCRSARNEKHPWVPRVTVARERDDRDRADDDDPVDDERPRPRLISCDAGAMCKIGEGGEGQPERTDGDDDRTRYSRPYSDSPRPHGCRFGNHEITCPFSDRPGVWSRKGAVDPTTVLYADRIVVRISGW